MRHLISIITRLYVHFRLWGLEKVEYTVVGRGLILGACTYLQMLVEQEYRKADFALVTLHELMTNALLLMSSEYTKRH